MTIQEIENICQQKQKELLECYFGNLVNEAAIERPETIGEYTKDLPLKIEAEFRTFLEELWNKHTPSGLRGVPLVMDEKKLRRLMTDDDREMIGHAYEEATEQTLWERINQTNHKDVTYYKGLLYLYTKDLLLVMRNDFLEEITRKFIKNKAFPDIKVCGNIQCTPSQCQECFSYQTPFCRYSYVAN